MAWIFHYRGVEVAMVFRNTIDALHSRCEALDQDLTTTRNELDDARRELTEAKDELHRVHADQGQMPPPRELEENGECKIEPPSERLRAPIGKVLDLSLSISLFGFIAMVGVSTWFVTNGSAHNGVVSGVGLCFAAAFVVSLVLIAKKKHR